MQKIQQPPAQEIVYGSASPHGGPVSRLASARCSRICNRRARSGAPKSWSREEIEKYPDEIARVHGETEINRLRDSARRIARSLKLTNEFKAMDSLIGAILGTRKTKLTALARAENGPDNQKGRIAVAT